MDWRAVSIPLTQTPEKVTSCTELGTGSDFAVDLGHARRRNVDVIELRAWNVTSLPVDVGGLQDPSLVGGGEMQGAFDHEYE